jgi:hypothetical protein
MMYDVMYYKLPRVMTAYIDVNPCSDMCKRHITQSIAIYTRNYKWQGLLAAYSTLQCISYQHQC